ncbi:MAG: glucosaminidase domain-containing protein [bacterium]
MTEKSGMQAIQPVESRTGTPAVEDPKKLVESLAAAKDKVSTSSSDSAGVVDSADLSQDSLEDLKSGHLKENEAKEEAKSDKTDEQKKQEEAELKKAELEKKIAELNKKIEEDLKKGDMNAYTKDLQDLQAAQKELDAFGTADVPDSTKTTRSVPGQGNTQCATPTCTQVPLAPAASPAQSSSGGGPITPSQSNPTAPINLSGNDKKTADFINDFLAKKGSPAAGKGAGEMMVKYGKENKVDPLILLSIAGQETQWGKTGIGVNGMLGVGAYDSDPNNATRNPVFSGIENQIKKGAETFARLRAKGGSSESASIANQVAAANQAGWATDGNWHNGVASIYAQISQQAQNFA